MNMMSLLKLLDSGPQLKDGHRFMFEMTGMFLGGFSKVKRIERKIPRKAYIEGGRNSSPLMLTEQQTELQQLVLEKGFVKVDPLLNAMRIELISKTQIFLPGILMVLDKNKIPIRIFVFEKGIVSEWSLSDLDAAKPTIMTDSVTISHSGLLEVSLSGIPKLW